MKYGIICACKSEFVVQIIKMFPSAQGSMKKTASILITGSEVLDGRVHDSNSFWMINELSDLSIGVEHVLSCDDALPAIKKSLQFLTEQTDVVIVSGGLGPTTDDLTREAIAEFCGVGLEENQTALEDMKAFFARLHRRYDESNNKQAFLPSTARIIRNSTGSAAGFWVTNIHSTGTTKFIFSLPGVPSELKIMFKESVQDILLHEVFKESSHIKPVKMGMRIFGLAEALIGRRVQESKPSEGIVVSYRACFPEVHVVLKDNGGACSLDNMHTSFQRAKEMIGPEHVFSEDLDKSMAEVVKEILVKRQLTLALAESCTGGLLGQLITAVPGSSAFLLGGMISYSNAVKEKLLGVNADQIKTFGAVSAGTAREMAVGAKTRFGSDIALSITGIAGPDGGSADKPVGTFYVGYSDAKETFACKCFCAGDRERIRVNAAYTALDTLRRKLSSFSLIHPIE